MSIWTEHGELIIRQLLMVAIQIVSLPLTYFVRKSLKGEIAHEVAAWALAIQAVAFAYNAISLLAFGVGIASEFIWEAIKPIT